MGDKGNCRIISKCLFSVRSFDCFFELGVLGKPYPCSAFVILYSYPASCLIDRHYPTLIQCWKTIVMMPLMASSSCPVSNGTAPLTSHHQTLHLQKLVSFSKNAFKNNMLLYFAIFLFHLFTVSFSGTNNSESKRPKKKKKPSTLSLTSAGGGGERDKGQERERGDRERVAGGGSGSGSSSSQNALGLSSRKKRPKLPVPPAPSIYDDLN